MFFSFTSLLLALTDDTAEDAARTAALGVGLAIVPFVFLIVAFGSRHPRAPVAVLKALGVWFVIGVSIGWFSVGLALVLAFGVGGMITLRADEPGAQRARMWALMFTVLYVLVLIVVLSPGIGLFAAASLPLLALGFADQWVEYKRRRAGGM
jgi:hypothetical protein